MIDLPEKVPVNRARIYCPPLLTSTDVVARSGITYRQLNTWAKRGWIVPLVDAPSQGYAQIWHPMVLNEIADIKERIDRCPCDHGQEA